MTFEPRFLTPLRFQDDGGLPFTLTDVLTYVTNIDHRGTFSVPVGFKTDLASVPRAFWRVLPPIGKYDAAAVLHDYLYQGAILNLGSVTRAQADAVLNEAMGVLGVKGWQRYIIYTGVRVGGSRIWNQYRDAA